MSSATQGHVGKPLAIVVNGTVVAAPTLRGAIHENALITGDFTRAEADEVAAGLTGK
jgi:preprotein translocase subunit SecD